MSRELGPYDIRYWRNQHGQGITIGEGLARRWQLYADAEGLDLETWVNRVIQRGLGLLAEDCGNDHPQAGAEPQEGPDSQGTADS